MDARDSSKRRAGLRYPEEIKYQAVDMYHQALPEYKAKKTTAQHVADLLGVGRYETVLAWVKQAEIDAGEHEGISTTENEEIRRLRRENAELKRANGILKAASTFFAAELDRPPNR